MNLELPFLGVEPSDLDEDLSRMDHDLDALFLGEVEATVEKLGAERPASDALAG